MALNTLKCNHLTSSDLKGLKHCSHTCTQSTVSSVTFILFCNNSWQFYPYHQNRRNDTVQRRSKLLHYTQTLNWRRGKRLTQETVRQLGFNTPLNTFQRPYNQHLLLTIHARPNTKLTICIRLNSQKWPLGTALTKMYPTNEYQIEEKFSTTTILYNLWYHRQLQKYT